MKCFSEQVRDRPDDGAGHGGRFGRPLSLVSSGLSARLPGGPNVKGLPHAAAKDISRRPPKTQSSPVLGGLERTESERGHLCYAYEKQPQAYNQESVRRASHRGA
jgi:hypothetical protein